MFAPCGPNAGHGFLASPTSPDARLERAAALSTGFFYLISRTGVTGERSEMASSGPALPNARAGSPPLPLAIGFGISTAAQVREVQFHADAAVVGSAVVHAIEEQFPARGRRPLKFCARAESRNGGSTRMSDLARLAKAHRRN